MQSASKKRTMAPASDDEHRPPQKARLQNMSIKPGKKSKNYPYGMNPEDYYDNEYVIFPSAPPSQQQQVRSDNQQQQFYDSGTSVASSESGDIVPQSPSPTVEHFVARHSNGTTQSIPKQPGYCKICTDRASGMHYGVLSCEGCKGFFRRSMAKQQDFRCRTNQTCVINVESRNRCQYCRLKKCLDEGMARNDNWRSSRVFAKKVVQPEVVAPIEYTQEDMTSAANTIIQRHMATCPFTEARVATIVSRPFLFEMTNDATKNRIHAWQSFCPELGQEIERIINSIREVPSLDAINPNDKAVLIKKHIFSLYVLRVIRAFSSKGLMLEDGRVLDFTVLRLLFGEMTERMINVANEVQRTKCLDGDLAILSIVMMLQPLPVSYQQEERFVSGRALAAAHTFYQSVLRQTMCAQEGGYERMMGLYSVLNMMEEMNTMVDRCFRDFLRQERQYLILADLFIEVLAINKRPMPAYRDQENYFVAQQVTPSVQLGLN